MKSHPSYAKSCFSVGVKNRLLFFTPTEKQEGVKNSGKTAEKQGKTGKNRKTGLVFHLSLFLRIEKVENRKCKTEN